MRFRNLIMAGAIGTLSTLNVGCSDAGSKRLGEFEVRNSDANLELDSVADIRAVCRDTREAVSCRMVFPEGEKMMWGRNVQCSNPIDLKKIEDELKRAKEYICIPGDGGGWKMKFSPRFTTSPKDFYKYRVAPFF